MAPAQMAYPPAAYTGFPGVAPSSSMMGGMMAPSVGMMAQPGAAGMVTPMAIPAGYVGNVQAAVIGVPNGMMAAQQAGYVAGMAAVPQPVYGVQPAQQLQWNITQVRGGLLLTRGWMEGGGGTGSKLPVPCALIACLLGLGEACWCCRQGSKSSNFFGGLKVHGGDQKSV